MRRGSLRRQLGQVRAIVPARRRRRGVSPTRISQPRSLPDPVAFYFADSNLKFDQPRVDIVIDRDRAAELSVNMQQVAADVGALLGGGYVDYFNIQGNSYKVIPQIVPRPRARYSRYRRRGHRLN